MKRLPCLVFASLFWNAILVFYILGTTYVFYPSCECACPTYNGTSIVPPRVENLPTYYQGKQIYFPKEGKGDKMWTFLPPRHFKNTSKFAYIFYATNDESACNVLIVSDKLKTLGQDPSISTLVIYPGGSYTKKFTDRNIIVIQTPVWERSGDPTWRYSTTKLKVFDYYGFERVVYLDSDSMPIANLDHLFLLPPGELYAPRAFWLTQPFFSSTLMVIMPVKERFIEITHAYFSKSHGFDMDILNDIFKHEVNFLPNSYVVPNGRFRRAPTEPTVNALADAAFNSHLFDTTEAKYGKFWRNRLPTKESLSAFHPMFFQIFEESMNRRASLC